MSPERNCVLIVEDDPGVADLQRRWLERAGFRVVMATSVDEAMARILDVEGVDAAVRVLIVEDDAATARLERAALERAGFTVATAGSVREGLEAMRDGEVSLVVLDHRLPDGSGIDLHEQLHAAGIDVPAVI